VRIRPARILEETLGREKSCVESDVSGWYERTGWRAGLGCRGESVFSYQLKVISKARRVISDQISAIRSQEKRAIGDQRSAIGRQGRRH
jgi:hypothetical protein